MVLRVINRAFAFQLRIPRAITRRVPTGAAAAFHSPGRAGDAWAGSILFLPPLPPSLPASLPLSLPPSLSPPLFPLSSFPLFLSLPGRGCSAAWSPRTHASTPRCPRGHSQGRTPAVRENVGRPPLGMPSEASRALTSVKYGLAGQIRGRAATRPPVPPASAARIALPLRRPGASRDLRGGRRAPAPHRRAGSGGRSARRPAAVPPKPRRCAWMQFMR